VAKKQGAIPSAIRFQRWKAPEVFGKALPFAGRQSERMPRPVMRTCTSTRTGFPSRLARIAGDKRCSRESREGTSARKLRRVSCGRKITRVYRCSALSACAFPMSCGPTWTVSLVGVRPLGASGLASRGWVSGNHRVARCGASSSNLLCIQKRKRRAAWKAHRAWQRLQGQPLQRARTALAVIVLVCRTLKISLQKSKGCDWLREAPASIWQAGVYGGLAEAIAFANATRYRNGETAQWDGTLAAKPTKAGQAHDIGSTPGDVRQTSQDGGRRNVPFDGSRARS